MRTQQQVKNIKKMISYNPNTGLCKRKNTPKNRTDLLNKTTGFLLTKKNRYMICCFGEKYYRSQVAFAIMSGYIPAIIDHKNGDTSDDRWCNLREATKAQNTAHSNLSKINKSGLPKGIARTSSGKFRGRVVVSNKQYMTKSFGSISRAHSEYLKLKKKLHGEWCGWNR